MKRLIYNAINTPDGTVLVSRSRHDFVSYQDENGKTYMVDGGLAYLRRSINDDQVELSMYEDEDHSVQRDILKWGSYGVDGTEPLHYISIGRMDTDHIEAVLKLANVMPVMADCMRRELEER